MHRAQGLAAIAAIFLTSVNGLPSDTGLVLTPRDDPPVCDTKDTYDDFPHSSCYVEKSSKNLVGGAVTASQEINCNTQGGCSNAVSEVQTITQSFTFEIGGEAGGDAGNEEGTFKAGVSAGASWMWGSSTANTLTETFTLKQGESGHIVFFPYLHQSCGALYYQHIHCGGDGCQWDQPPSINDPNACGTTPLLIHQSGGDFANGCFQFCHTDGANPSGCDPDPAKCVPPSV